MAITTALTNAAKQAFLRGEHAAGDTYKLALIKVGHTGTYDKNTLAAGTPGTGAPSTSNLGTDEVTGTGYTTGGATLSGYTVTLTVDTASIDWGNATWPAATISAVGAMLYNDTDAGKPCVAVFDFGGTVTSTADLYTVQIPTTGVGVVRIA